MIVYNVTVQVQEEIAREWVDWILNEHAQEVLDTKCFHKYELFEIIDHPEEGLKTYAVKYFTTDKKSYDNYIKDYSKQLRDKGLEKFGDKFVGFRTLMQMIANGE